MKKYCYSMSLKLSKPDQLTCTIILLLCILSTASCKVEESSECTESVCFSSDANLIGERHSPTGGVAYLVKWQGDQFGVYESSSTEFKAKEADTIEIPLDEAAQFVFEDAQGQILVQPKDTTAKFIHFIELR